MRGAVKCPACGAKTSARRTHCPRCRASLTPQAPPPPARRRWAAPVAVVCVAGIALTAGVVFRVGSSSTSVSATPSAADGGQSPSKTAAGAATGLPTPSGTAPAIDSSRSGLAAYAQGNVAAAIQQFTAAVEAAPSDSEALNNLGQALVRAGRSRDAVPYFDRAIAADDDVWTYHFNRARAYGEMQDWGRAIDGYRDATRLFPDDYATAFNLARALQTSGDLPAAIEEFRRAERLAPSEPDFPLALASALERAQRPGDAVDAYKRYLDLQDSGPTADKVRKRITELESKS